MKIIYLTKQINMVMSNAMKNGLVPIAGFFMVSAIAFAGNGAGVNGPDLSGLSIPVRLDRGIHANALEQAMETCLVTGDEKRQLTSTLQKLYRQIYGANAVVKNTHSRAAVHREDRDSSGGTASYLSGEIANNPSILRLDETGILEFYVRVPEAEAPRSYHLQLNGSLPKVSWESSARDCHFDVFGAEECDDLLLQGVTIQPGLNHGSAVSFKNVETNVNTGMTLNSIELVECIQEEIQRNAE